VDNQETTKSKNGKIREEGHYMTSKEINAFIRKHYKKMTDAEIATKLSLTAMAVEHRRLRMSLRREKTYLSPKEGVDADIKTLQEKTKRSEDAKKYKTLLEEMERLRIERDAVKQIADVNPHRIEKIKTNRSEATAVVLASDWHCEETVNPKTINQLNSFSLNIATARAEMFFRNTARLMEIFEEHTHIDKLVLALLGDFISGSIHDELMEGNALRPIDAMLFAQNLVASGIEYLIANTDKQILIPCHSGNHGRATHKQRHATEAGNSFEYYMYHTLANHFRNEPRVKFLISEGYISYLEVYNTTLRFHHGHNIKYQGGVGGIFIPAFKAINQWNKAHWADIDCFGHFHQMKNGGNFISNGCLIGYNAYAQSIKADFERPTQAFFLINPNYGVEMVTKIRLE
jgi:hypothetical protein